MFEVTDRPPARQPGSRSRFFSDRAEPTATRRSDTGCTLKASVRHRCRSRSRSPNRDRFGRWRVSSVLQVRRARLRQTRAWQVYRTAVSQPWGFLLELFKSLKPRGVLFSSNPRGNNEEGFSEGRYACFFDLDTWRDYVIAAGFVELDHYYRPPGLPRDRQPWLATVWRKA